MLRAELPNRITVTYISNKHIFITTLEGNGFKPNIAMIPEAKIAKVNINETIN